MSFVVVVHSTKQCKATHLVTGRYLKGHVISSENVENIGVCYGKCSKNQRCKSINFHFDELLCELNDADRYTHPWDYVLKKNLAYNDYPIKVCIRYVSVFTLFVTVEHYIKPRQVWESSKEGGDPEPREEASVKEC